MKDPRFGSQNGLLSEAECQVLTALMGLVPKSPLRVLEVGHFLGLSTWMITLGLRRRGGSWTVTTVDAHCADPWVPATDPQAFLANRDELFPEVTDVRFIRSETLEAPLEWDVVFYDGDHGEEQLRFTEAVIASPSVELFVFDDRDFPVPAKCEALLAATPGWEAISMIFKRLHGDKTHPETMTLAAWRRTHEYSR